MRKFITLFLVLSAIQGFSQKYENLAITPPMGWNSWNTFQTNINEQLVKDIADIMVSSGMKDAGYTYLVLDDGWMSMQRDSITGDLIADPVKFPHGMKAVSDYVHSKGLKFGLYNCAGTKTCAGYPGTRGYEYQDARLYASWDIDYLKFDWCNTEGINAKEAYTTMSKALKAARRPIVFSLCEWGTNKPWEWAASVGQLWRTTGDIAPVFDSTKNYGNWSALGVMKIADLQVNIRKYAGTGHWNDPDMLEVGNGMTNNEDKSHFSIWAMLAAPLMAGNDLRKMKEETRVILTNKEVISIDQDEKGIEGFRYNSVDSLETWCKPLSNGDWAICFLNRSQSTRTINWNWQTEQLVDTINNIKWNYAPDNKIRDLWAHKYIGTTKNPLKAIIPSHDVLMIKISKH